MQISLKKQAARGEALITVLIIAGVICIVLFSMLQLSSNSTVNAYGRVDWDKSFYAAENAMVWAAQNAFDNSLAAGSSNYYSTAAGTLPTRDLICSSSTDPAFQGAWVTIVQPANQPANNFQITSSARVNNKVRTLQTQITVRPASSVFDYEYFLNNWGWWWGSTITGNGGQRANWDFDFRGGPTVNGAIYAADQVQDNEIPYQNYSSPPFAGQAGADETNLVHDGAQSVTMPNLLNFSNYMVTAMANTASNGLWLGSTQVVFGVLSNSYTPNPGGNAGNLSPQTGLYAVGTAANPITIKGTVVIPGDLIIQGIIKGQGTFYVGGNLYLANNVSYSNAPNFSALPESQSPTNRDAWVAASQTNDLVAYAVRGSILGGDVTDSSDWYPNCFTMSGSGLQNVGDESHLGADGISGTGDDNTAFLHADGSMSTWYDADGDGTVNGDYNYNNDINMTSSRASYIKGYPKDSNGNPLAYNQLATTDIGMLQGIFYTDHAAAIRLKQSQAYIDGVIVSRNEQIIFQNYLNIIYDSRVNSRYHNNPNNIINLGLPWGKPISVTSFAELAPNHAGL